MADLGSFSDHNRRRPEPYDASYLNFSHPFGIERRPGYHDQFPSLPSERPSGDVDISEFQNRIPNPYRISATADGLHGVHDDETHGHGAEDEPESRPNIFTTILWPLTIVIIPVTLLCAGILAVVFILRVNSADDRYHEPAQDEKGHILVNYSATRIAFLSSFLSSVAPILGGFVMTLWGLPLAQSMRLASLEGRFDHLPTPYQISLLVGISLASYERLYRYLMYMMCRTRPSIPRLLQQNAMMFCLTILLSIGVFCADTWLHYSLETIPFSQATEVSPPGSRFGRDVADYCLMYERSQNYGLPCTYDPFGKNPNWSAQQNEVFRLQHDSSSLSQIQYFNDAAFQHGDLAVLTPRNIPSEIDFHAATIGISSQCETLSSKCEMRVGGADGLHTLFNCSNNFWGILGSPAQTTQLDGTVDMRSDISPLSYKPATNLQ